MRDSSQYLVCGGRRTGTTLLAAILSSDARTNPLGQEAQILTRVIEAYRWGREHFDQFGQSFFGDLETYRLSFQQAAAQLTHEASKRISPGGVLVLKNPELSRVLLDAADLFPEALFLATVRDPRDQVASELEVRGRQRAGSDQDLADKEDNNQVDNVIGFEKENAAYCPATTKLEVRARRLAARTWNYVFKKSKLVRLAHGCSAYYREILALRKRQPHRIHIVRYEDLVLHPDQALADLRDFTGLALTFDPSKPWSRVSPQASLHSGPSRSSLYGGPVDAGSVGRYKRDMSAKQAAIVQSACAGLMDELGYQRMN